MEVYDGTELCCNCNNEFVFTFIPQKSIFVKCPHCNTLQHPCSMCYECDNECEKNLKAFVDPNYIYPDFLD